MLVENICAVIVTFNRLEKLQYTLATYIESGIKHIVVVNNASSDGTAEFLNNYAEKDVHLDILHLPENTGGAGGFHIGLQFASQLEGIDWVVVSDDDSYPDIDAFTTFTQDTERLSSYSIIASAVYYPDETICFMNQPMLFPSFLKALFNIFSGKKVTGIDASFYNMQETVDINAASFVGMFINHDALTKSNILPDASYFLYWDDIAYCLEMTKQGHKIGFVPKVRFIHDCARKTQVLSELRLYYMVRNGIRVIKKLPMSLKFISYCIKLPAWLLVSIKNRSVSYFIKAIQEA